MYFFGPFSLDYKARLLLRDGKPVPLTAKVFDTLTVLVKNHGNITDKDYLLSTLWPDTVVEEGNLTQNISTLRKVLGDHPSQGRYIATIQGRGYSFVAPVTDLQAPPLSTAVITEPSPLAARDGRTAPSETGVPVTVRRGQPRSLKSWHSAAIALVIVIAVLLWVLNHSREQSLVVIERQLTTNSPENSVSSMAISPDGKHLAYADNTGIFLKLIQTGEIHPLALPPDFTAEVDDWFPDGSHLLVSRLEHPGTASLWSVSVFGGPPRRLVDNASGGSLSPDGAHIAFHRGDLTYEGLWGREEWVMRSDGTELVKAVANRSDASEVGVPTWSPDGKRIAYIRSNWAYNARTSSVEVNEWRKTYAETVYADKRLSPALRWLPDGRIIYALGSAQRQQDSSLWVGSLQQSKGMNIQPQRLTEGHGWISRVTTSADGKTVTFLRGNWLPSVYVATLAHGGTRLISNRRLTLDENENIPTSWTPDSKAVLLSSDRDGSREIFRQSIDQPLAENLVSGADHASLAQLSPDGSEIVYLSVPKSAGPEAHSSILAIPISGGRPRLILKDIKICNVQCARLPSTTCMYTVAKGDAWETFRFDLRTGKSADHRKSIPRATGVCLPMVLKGLS